MAQAMNAPASITITPVHVADLHVEGELMPINVHVIDHPDGRVLVDTGLTELHPAVADLDPRLHPLSKQDFDLAGIDIVVNTHLWVSWPPPSTRTHSFRGSRPATASCCIPTAFWKPRTAPANSSTASVSHAGSRTSRCRRRICSRTRHSAN